MTRSSTIPKGSANDITRKGRETSRGKKTFSGSAVSRMGKFLIATLVQRKIHLSIFRARIYLIISGDGGMETGGVKDNSDETFALELRVATDRVPAESITLRLIKYRSSRQLELPSEQLLPSRFTSPCLPTFPLHSSFFNTFYSWIA